VYKRAASHPYVVQHSPDYRYDFVVLPDRVEAEGYKLNNEKHDKRDEIRDIFIMLGPAMIH
jgi:hypothetical protein